MVRRRDNLGNGGIASRQRSAVPGVNQPLGPPTRIRYLRSYSQARNLPLALAPAVKQASSDGDHVLSSGSIGFGMGSVIRIPVPGSNGLAIELKAIDWNRSTSALFFQSADGKRVLRLDYGPNKVTGKIDYHWNQKGTFDFFGIPDHSSAGNVGEALFQGAKYYKYAGRVFLVAGAIADAYSIVVAKERLRQVVRVTSGWTGAWAGAELVGSEGAALGAEIGTFIEPGGGTAVGAAIFGFVGAVIGGVGGYNATSWAGTKVYDWVKETYFEPLPEERAPHK